MRTLSSNNLEQARINLITTRIAVGQVATTALRRRLALTSPPNNPRRNPKHTSPTLGRMASRQRHFVPQVQFPARWILKLQFDSIIYMPVKL
jgi:hypothetical protein